MKPLYYVIGAVALLVIFSNVSPKEGQKLGMDPTETIWGYVYNNGVPVSGAAVKITIHSSAATGTMADSVYSATTGANGQYIAQVQWQGNGDSSDGDPVIVVATANGKSATVNTKTGTTPFRVDVSLAGTLPSQPPVVTPPACKKGAYTTYYASGKISTVENYVNCVKSDYQYAYYDTTSSAKQGIIQSKQYYTNGVMSGHQYEYWPDGKVKTDYNYNSKGQRDGTQLRYAYYSSGVEIFD